MTIDVRRDLIALRVKHGADTPIGHRCSNLIEQLASLHGAPYDLGVIIRGNIQRSMAELAELTK